MVPARVAAQTARELSPQVSAQIDALMAEKLARTPAQRKMDSNLIYAAKMARGERIALNVSTMRVTFSDVNARGVVVDVRADVSDRLLDQLRKLGADVISVSVYRSIRLRIGTGQLEALAALPDVSYVQPKQEATTSRSPMKAAPHRRHSQRCRDCGRKSSAPAPMSSRRCTKA